MGNYYIIYTREMDIDGAKGKPEMKIWSIGADSDEEAIGVEEDFMKELKKDWGDLYKHHLIGVTKQIWPP